MSQFYIPLIVGTARPNRESIKVGNYLYQQIKANTSIETELLLPEQFNLPLDGDMTDFRDDRYMQITSRADGFIIVVPEYNHSFPGSLKRLLDSEYNNYSRKPVALVGVSSGPWGGVRAIQSLIAPLRKMGMVLMPNDLQFPNVADQFDDQGMIKNPDYQKRVDRLMSEFLWYVATLKAGRE